MACKVLMQHLTKLGERVAIFLKDEFADGAEAVCRSAEALRRDRNGVARVRAALEVIRRIFKAAVDQSRCKRVTVSLALRMDHIFAAFARFVALLVDQLQIFAEEFLKALVCTPLCGALADHCVQKLREEDQAACRPVAILALDHDLGAALVVIVARPLLGNAEAGKIRDPDRIVEHHRLAASGLDRAHDLVIEPVRCLAGHDTGGHVGIRRLERGHRLKAQL